VDTEALKKSLLKKFQEISGDRLQKIQLGVLELEKATGAAAADEVARELHTMKGEARMLGLSAVGQLAHACEDLLKAHREGRASTAVATDLLLQGCDALSDLLDDMAGAQSGTEASASICEVLARAAGAPIPPLHPGGKASSGLKTPPAAVVPAAPPGGAPAGQGDEPAPAPKPPAQDRSIRVHVETLDAMGLLAGDLLVESARARLRSAELEALFQRFTRMGDRFVRMADRLGDAAEALDERERRQFDLLENDLDMLRDDAFRFVRRHGDGMNTLHGNLSQLADHVAQARLVPLSTLFDAFPRAVRDIAKQMNKEVELSVDNAGIGVDRSMLSDLRDAVVHLIRNSVDHGLEAPEVRESLGKPRAGRLSLRVRADGDMLHLEVEDDGRGIDPEALRQAVVKRRQLTRAQAAALSEREAVELVFQSGLSTREEVSELSGRGVGMDVVKRKVEGLGGSVSVHSRVGLGTTISLRLPQSLSLMRVLLVRLGDDVYGIPAADVEAVIRVRPDERVDVSGNRAVRHRGIPTVLVALGPLLGLNGGNRFDRPPAVVVRHGDDRAALVVDSFVEEREVAVKPCGGDFLKSAAFLAGTAALEDGRIAVLLHVPDIMSEVRKAARPAGAAAANVSRRLRILLVDDSPIARATESALVRALGHAVEEAQDGEEAYQKLTAEPFDILLTDVQMPRMDGFQLTRRLKASAATARVPVIILSSLASPEDRRRGLDAGADAYLVKGELGVESLAQAIDRLV